MKKSTVEAIVLKNVNYKDAHRIYTLLTKEKGKITAIAHGVRKISSKRAGSLDTLNNISVNISEDKGGFYSISEVKVLNSYAKLKESLDFILAGLYFSELVDVFLENYHENTEIFTLLKSALTVLSKKPTRAQLVVNVFELRLLNKLGIGLTVDKCITCGRILNSDWNKAGISYDYGGLVCDLCIKHEMNLALESAYLLQSMVIEKDLRHLDKYTKKSETNASNVIKTHLKKMVETYAKYPRLSRFLTDSVL